MIYSVPPLHVQKTLWSGSYTHNFDLVLGRIGLGMQRFTRFTVIAGVKMSTVFLVFGGHPSSILLRFNSLERV